MRFYIPDFNINKPCLSGEAHTHAAYSLRIRPNDFLTVFDGNGNEYLCTVEEIKKDLTTLKITDKKTNVGEAGIFVTLYMSVIKQDRFEWAVQKATELGVSAIVPVYSEHTQHNITLNTDRLKKIAASACEQCGRSRVPEIKPPVQFDKLTAGLANTYFIFPWERELNGSLKNTIDTVQKNISVFVGPEGGITVKEKEQLVAAGAKPVTLGKRILRAETAAIATLSVIFYEMGEWLL